MMISSLSNTHNRGLDSIGKNKTGKISTFLSFRTWTQPSFIFCRIDVLHKYYIFKMEVSLNQLIV